MPVRLKVRYLTRMEKRCIGYSGNGTKASTAEAPLRLLVSGERVSVPVNQSQTSGGVWPEELQVGWHQGPPSRVSNLYLL